MKKCPYCGRRILYSSVFSSKTHGSYCCERCKKESKVKINNKMILLFIALCLLVFLFMIFWVSTGNLNNFFGVILVSICFISFYLATPIFVDFIPLKKYQNDIKQNEEININTTTPPTDFIFNKEAFDKIKRQKELGIMSFDNSSNKNNQNLIPVIEDVKEGHISSTDEPLHKINRTAKQYVKNNEVYIDDNYQEEVKRYVPKNKKPDGNRYTANRRF